MHEYHCSCHINGKSYEFKAKKCHNLTKALSNFYILLLVNHKADIEEADGIIIDKVEVDA